MLRDRLAMGVWLAALFLSPQVCLAWSPCIHGAIALKAFESLSSDDQADILNLLRHHPQYDEMIAPPEGSDEEQSRQIIIANAGMWADRIAGTKNDRPKWHFYDGVLKTVGDVSAILPPEPPTDLPSGDPEDPHALNLVQAIKLCQRTVRNLELPDAERAVALCWLMNLWGDLHQPMHLGSLYADPIFADGDDHGREILIGSRTLLEMVDDFLNRNDRFSDVLALKLEYDLDDHLQRSFESASKFAGREWYIRSVIGMSRGDAVGIYSDYEEQISEAAAAGKAPPLKAVGAPGTFFYMHGRTLIARAAGSLSTTLSNTFNR